MPQALAFIMLIALTSCKLKYTVENELYTAYFDDKANVTSITPKKHKDNLTAFFVTEVNRPNPDSLSEIFLPIFKKGYKIIVINKPGEGDDYYRTLSLDNKTDRENQLANYMSAYISKHNIDSTQLMIIGSGLDGNIVPSLASNFRIPRVILINPMYESLETNLAFISQIENTKEQILDTVLNLQGKGLISFMQKVSNPENFDDVIGNHHIKYWRSYMQFSPGRYLDILEGDITIIQFTDYPYTSTFDKNKIKQLALEKEWRLFFEPAPENQEERVETIKKRLKEAL